MRLVSFAGGSLREEHDADRDEQRAESEADAGRQARGADPFFHHVGHEGLLSIPFRLTNRWFWHRGDSGSESAASRASHVSARRRDRLSGLGNRASRSGEGP